MSFDFFLLDLYFGFYILTNYFKYFSFYRIIATLVYMKYLNNRNVVNDVFNF